MNYQQTLDFLFNQLPIFQRQGKIAFNKDLGKTIALCKAIQNPEKNLRFIHVAGTNGKGTVCHTLASVCKESGLKTGLYTSPHLLDFRERIMVDGEYIQKDFVVDFVENYRSAIDDIKPSFFELTFAMALKYFENSGAEIVVLETGMGGKLDSTNVISPIISIITNIGLDHQQYLGNTIAEIAIEKVGIIKNKIPALLSDTKPEVIEIFKETCHKNESQGFQTSSIVSLSKRKQLKFEFINGLNCEINSPFKAEYQYENMLTVAAAWYIIKDELHLNLNHLVSGIVNLNTNFSLKGRWQKLQEEPMIICDVCHNKDGIARVLEQLKNESFNKLHIVFGMVNDKSTDTLELLPKTATYYLCEADIPRALPIHNLTKLMEHNQFSVSIAQKNVATVFNYAKTKAQKGDLILVMGSLFVVAEVLALFEN